MESPYYESDMEDVNVERSYDIWLMVLDLVGVPRFIKPRQY